jgi:hypothetical protein
MNSLPKLIASIAALIASLSVAWIAFSVHKAIPGDGIVVYQQVTQSPRF